MEEIKETEKVKLASFYLDGMTLYWHQNFTKSIRGRAATWEEYTEAMCGRFGGHQDPLEELMELRQTGSLETYIQDFDVLWNKADISERQAMVFFIEGLEIKIKNPVKMFDPKALRQAYNLARLQDNTLSYRTSQPQSHQTQPKCTPHSVPSSVPFKQNTLMPYSRQTVTPNITTFRQPQQGILPPLHTNQPELSGLET
jgi:predicted O-linked N-acetylglucosamine transferase (SPINDLY family)